MTKTNSGAMDRRRFVVLTGAGAAAAWLGSYPIAAEASAESVTEAMKKFIGDRKPKAGRITLTLPEIAENGRTVPISLKVDSPMTDKDYVKAVHIFADGNPRPDIASFRYTPSSGRAEAATRIRLAKTQNIVAVAEMSDGSVYMVKNSIKVTIGGCGG